jgi:hypothetical protein
MVGADLFWEKSTTGWLLVAGLFWEKSNAGCWLISRTNRLSIDCKKKVRLFRTEKKMQRPVVSVARKETFFCSASRRNESHAFGRTGRRFLLRTCRCCDSNTYGVFHMCTWTVGWRYFVFSLLNHWWATQSTYSVSDSTWLLLNKEKQPLQLDHFDLKTLLLTLTRRKWQKKGVMPAAAYDHCIYILIGMNMDDIR